MINVIRMPFLTAILTLLLLQRCAWRLTRRSASTYAPFWLVSRGRACCDCPVDVGLPTGHRSTNVATPPWRRHLPRRRAPRPLQVAAVRFTRCTAALPWGDAQLAPRQEYDAAHGTSFARECGVHSPASRSCCQRGPQRAAPAAPSPFCVFAIRADDGGAGVGDDGVVAVDESVPSRPPKTGAICHVLAPRADDGGDGVADDGVVGVA